MDEQPATTEPPAEPEPALDVEDIGAEYVSLEELVTGLVVDDGQIVDEDVGLVVTLDKLATEFPIELRIESGAAGLQLSTAPPTQHVETTILPVWHQLRVTIVRTPEDE